jgi:iron(III) transport system permease protein
LLMAEGLVEPVGRASNVGRNPSINAMRFGGPLFAAILLVASLSLTDIRQRGLLLETLYIVACVEIAVIPWAIATAWFWQRTQFVGRSAVGPLVCLAMLIPLYLHCAGWEAGFGRLGWQTALANRTGDPILSKHFAVIWIHVMHAWGWGTAILAVALRRIDRTLEDAARMEGNEWSVFYRITLPQILPAVAIAVVWIGLLVAGEMTVTNIYIVRTFAEEVYTHFSVSSSSWSAIIGVLPGTLAITSLAALAMAMVPARRFSTMPRPLSPTPSPWLGWIGGCFVWLSIGIVLGVPLANMLYKSGLTIHVESGHPHFQWSIEKLFGTLSKGVSTFRNEFSATAMLAAYTACASVALGAILAWWLRLVPNLRWPVGLVLAGLLATPAPIVGVLVIRLMNQPAIPFLTTLYDNTLTAPVLAIMARTLPLATLICWQAFAAIPQPRLDLARIEGANSWMLLARIALPSCWPAILSSAFACAALAAGDLSCSILTLPPGVDTVAFRMFGFIHVGSDEQVCAIGLLSAAMFSLIAWPAWRWFEQRL